MVIPIGRIGVPLSEGLQDVVAVVMFHEVSRSRDDIGGAIKVYAYCHQMMLNL